MIWLFAIVLVISGYLGWALLFAFIALLIEK